MSSFNRDEIIKIWHKHCSDQTLFKHAIAVESCMRGFAKLYNEDEDKWGAVGLLHDLDYEKYPKEHCKKVVELLQAENNSNIDGDFIRAIQSHGFGLCTDIEPKTDMEKALYTVDELSGFIVACALVRPSKSLDDLELKSVKKKWKDKTFAAGVDRAVIENGCNMLNKSLDEVITSCIEALKANYKELGLKKIS